MVNANVPGATPVVSSVIVASKPWATTVPLDVVTVRKAIWGTLPGSTGCVLFSKNIISGSENKSTAVITGPDTTPPAAEPPSATWRLKFIPRT